MSENIIKVSGMVRCFVYLGEVLRILHEEGERLVVTDYNLKRGVESERIELCEDFGAIICSARGESGNEEENTRIWSAIFSQDGRLLILGLGNGDVIVCGGKESEEASVGEREYGVGLKWGGAGLRGHATRVVCVSASMDGAHVVSGGRDGKVRVWQKEGETWRSSVLEGHTETVESVSVSMDGAHVVSGGGDNTVRVWQKEEGMWRSSVLEGHAGIVKSVRVSTDGAHVVSGGLDRTVRVWQKEGGTWSCCLIRKLNVNVDSVEISKDGREIIVNTENSTEMTWRTEGDRWVEMKRQHVMATWQGINILREEEAAEVVKATDASELRKTTSGYVLGIDRAPYIVFADVVQ